MSDSSRDMFPSNTLSRFSVQLPKIIHLPLEEEWSVGLCEMSYPYSFNSLDLQALPKSVTDHLKTSILVTRVGRLEFEAKIFNSFIEFYKSIRAQIKDVHKAEILMSELQFLLNEDLDKIIDFQDKKMVWTPNPAPVDENRRTTITFALTESKRGDTAESIEIHLPIRIYYGFSDLFKEIRTRIPSLELLKRVNYHMQDFLSTEFAGLYLKSNNEQINEPTREMTPTFVQVNIIEPLTVGDSEVRTLRILQFPDPTGHHKFKNIYYMPVERSRIEYVSVLITDKFGDQIKFETSAIPVILTLHFKKASDKSRIKLEI